MWVPAFPAACSVGAKLASKGLLLLNGSHQSQTKAQGVGQEHQVLHDCIPRSGLAAPVVDTRLPIGCRS